MERHGRYAVTMACVSLTPLAAFALFNWIMDPLQFYRKAAYTPEFSLQQRYQNPGLAKNYPYDTAVIGSSLAESLAPSRVEALLGVRSINLSFKGASAFEMNRILRVAIRSGRLKRALWCMDIFAFRGAPDRTAQEEGDFPYHLYDRNPFNDARYLLNLDVFRSSANLLLDSLRGRRREPMDLDQLHNSYSAPEAYSENAVLAKWEKESAAYDRGVRRFSKDPFTLNVLRESFDRNALAFCGFN